MRIVLALTLLVLSAGCAAATTVGGCRNPSVPLGETVERLLLPPKPEGRYFYFRSFSYDYAIVVSPSVVVAALESWAAGGNKDAAELLTMVRSDLPLSRDSDLFRYVLANSYYLSQIQRLLVQELDSGRAAIFEATTGMFLERVKATRENSARGASRSFATLSGTLLLSQVDCIAD